MSIFTNLNTVVVQECFMNVLQLNVYWPIIDGINDVTTVMYTVVRYIKVHNRYS